MSVDDGSQTTLNQNEYVEYTWDLDPDETIQVNVEYGIVVGNAISTTFELEAGYTTEYTVVQENGELHLTNNSSREVWYLLDGGDLNTLTANQTDQWTYDMLEYEQTNTQIDYSGYHVFTNTSIETITGGSITNFVIEPDGGGIEFHNDMLFTNITEVYLSPSEDPTWGENDLDGILYPGEFTFWTVSPGSWDILAIDEYGVEYTTFDNIITLDETSVFYVEGWDKTGKSYNNMKNRKTFPDFKTEDRVELKNPNLLK